MSVRLTDLAQGATWVYLVRDRNSGCAPVALSAANSSGASADVYREPVGDSLSSGSGILWGNEHDSSENHSGSTSSTGSAGVGGGGSARDGLFCYCPKKTDLPKSLVNSEIPGSNLCRVDSSKSAANKDICH